MNDKDLGRAAFRKEMNVSRETMQDLEAYADLLRKWSPRINLISKSSMSDLWTRHILDSAQLVELAKRKSGHWVDLGSGGGFPGMVIAIIAKRKMPDLRFTFVESDRRKAVFLQTVVRDLSLQADVVAKRAEDIGPLSADTLSARALAPLPTLLGYVKPHLLQSGQALLMKGQSFRRELDQALEIWSFQGDECPSITDGAAVILSLGDIQLV